jgi:hypothetical protein
LPAAAPLDPRDERGGARKRRRRAPRLALDPQTRGEIATELLRVLPPSRRRRRRVSIMTSAFNYGTGISGDRAYWSEEEEGCLSPPRALRRLLERPSSWIHLHGRRPSPITISCSEGRVQDHCAARIQSGEVVGVRLRSPAIALFSPSLRGVLDAGGARSWSALEASFRRRAAARMKITGIRPGVMKTGGALGFDDAHALRRRSRLKQRANSSRARAFRDVAGPTTSSGITRHA